MTDFSDRPFVAGSLTGLRAFAVDRFGRLRGPSFNQVFTPDENVAVCRKSEAGITFNVGSGGLMRMALSSSFFLPQPPPSPYVVPRSYTAGISAIAESGFEREPEPERTLAEEAVAAKVTEPPAHVVGGVKCTCGFYAYFDGGNDYKQDDRVTAVIQGYGVCTVGARGFRAEKARLLALVTPKRMDPARWALVERNYPEVPTFARKRDALVEHPLTQSELPSPDDSDFWTRGDA